MFLSNFSSGGEALLVGAIIGLGMFLLIYFIRTAKSKGQKAISDYQLKKDPYNINALIKSGFDKLVSDNSGAISQFEKVRRIQQNNFAASIGLSIAFHLDKQYAKSKKLFLEIFDSKTISTPEESENVDMFIIALAGYLFGHIAYMDGDVDMAGKRKQFAESLFPAYPELEKIVKTLDLY